MGNTLSFTNAVELTKYLTGTNNGDTTKMKEFIYTGDANAGEFRIVFLITNNDVGTSNLTVQMINKKDKDKYCKGKIIKSDDGYILDLQTDFYKDMKKFIVVLKNEGNNGNFIHLTLTSIEQPGFEIPFKWGLPSAQ